MRLISVSALKEWVENWFTKNRFYHPYAKDNNIPIVELYDILEQMPSAQPEQRSFSCGQENDPISRQTAIDVVHKIIYGFFDLVDDDSEEQISDKDKLLLEVNKAICNGIRGLVSAQPEPCEDAVNKIKNASFTGSDGLDYVETLVALDALKLANCSSAQPVARDINVLSNDLISRQSAIDALAKHEKSKGHNYTLFVDIVSECAEVIRDLPSITPKAEQRWILCSERLPENDDFVFVTVLDEQGDTPYRYSDFGWYLDRAKCWIIDIEQRTDVIAWMPLPEPYTERRTE